MNKIKVKMALAKNYNVGVIIDGDCQDAETIIKMVIINKRLHYNYSILLLSSVNKLT